MAVLTAFLYLFAQLLQLGYFITFGIDIFIVTPRADPASLLVAFILAIFITMAWAQMKVMNSVEKKYGEYLWLTEIVIILGLLIYGLYAIVFISEPYITEVYKALDLVCIILPIMYINARIDSFKFIRKKTKASIPDALIFKPYLYQYGLRPNAELKKKRLESFSALIILGSILLFVMLPIITGSAFAEGRTDFTAIESVKKESAIKNVVIGETAEGYIVKDYDIAANKFTNSWRIIKSENAAFYKTKINSLRKQ